MSNKSFNRIGNFKYTIYVMIIIIIILFGLNVIKFKGEEREVVTAWSREEQYFVPEEAEKNLLQKIKEFAEPENLIFRLTRVRLKAPITYLKREIPLLGYYTPDELKKPTRTVYQVRDQEKDKVIKLEFDLRQAQLEEKTEIAPLKSKKVSPNKRSLEASGKPLIAIYHTHTSETYIDDPRNQDNNGHVLPGNIGNVARVGSVLGDSLASKYNFKVIHTTKIHDEQYIKSYYNSRQTVKKLLNNYPEIDMLLDIHRDGIEAGGKETYTALVNGQRMARVMIVVTNGKFDFAHLNLKKHHLEWRRNLNFARRLAAKMEEMYPGLLKRLEIRNTTYNQDLHPQSILLEIGDYQNTTREATRSARRVADVIAAVTNLD